METTVVVALSELARPQISSLVRLTANQVN